MRDSHASSVHRSGDVVSVLLPLPLGPYDYRVPPDGTLADGDFVTVPLGPRHARGVVWGAGRGGVAPGKLKDVAERLGAPPMPAAIRAFVDWVAAYTLAPAGAVLRMAMSVPDALDPPAGATVLVPGAVPPTMRPTAARRRVIAVAGGGALSPSELAREAAVSPSVVKGLVAAGALRAVAARPAPAFAAPDPGRPGPVLAPAQADAAAALRAAVAAERFAVTLLDGVPGSGKTEVYFEAVAEALSRRRQVLVMLPEIALGAQWLERFRDRFGVAPAAWHSELTAARRRVTWRAVASGEARVVVGARSALFLPFIALGLVVVDEEHDAAFKQDDGVCYNARDMAVVRGRLAAAPVVLASATPSLESHANAETGRYRRLHLPARHGGAPLPEVAAIDMRTGGPERGRWLAPPLRQALEETLAAGEQALLFLNRRGYAPLTLCRACGHRLQCPNCSAWLVEHRLPVARLTCHHCGFSRPPPAACPACAAADSLTACGPGVERVVEEVNTFFPDLRVATATSDRIAGPAAAEALVGRIERHEVDVIVGTQIVAKGYHFPMLTLVGVVDADLGLSGGDLRAAERTYQLLYQVAGRAGRAERPGRVVLQTYMPAHPVMEALLSGQRDRFIAAETEARRVTGMPPFGRLVALVVSSPDEAAADAAARALARTAPRANGLVVLGPAPAPLALLRGRHRRRLLLKARRDVAVQPVVRAWLAGTEIPRKARVQVDVDPYGFM